MIRTMDHQVTALPRAVAPHGAGAGRWSADEPSRRGAAGTSARLRSASAVLPTSDSARHPRPTEPSAPSRAAFRPPSASTHRHPAAADARAAVVPSSVDGLGSVEREGQPMVLVIAHLPILRLQNVKMVASLGYRALEVADAEQALAIYQRVQPRAVLLDITQMEATALHLIRTIRRIDDAARIAVFASHASRTLVLQALQAGACHFLVKPVPTTRLVQALQDLVSTPTERRHPRVATALRATMTIGMAQGTCVIKDLSVGGARCRVDDDALIRGNVQGEVVQLRFVLPDRPEPVLVIGRIAWSAAATSMGLTFLQLAEEDQARVERFCHWAAQYQIQEEGTVADRRAS